MKKFKGLSVTWWVTQITGFIIYLLCVAMIIFNSFPVLGSSLTISQKITYILGTGCVCYGLLYIEDEIVRYIRKKINKHKKYKHNRYTPEQIDKINEQMKHSVDHLK